MGAGSTPRSAAGILLTSPVINFFLLTETKIEPDLWLCEDKMMGQSVEKAQVL